MIKMSITVCEGKYEIIVRDKDSAFGDEIRADRICYGGPRASGIAIDKESAKDLISALEEYVMYKEAHP